MVDLIDGLVTGSIQSINQSISQSVVEHLHISPLDKRLNDPCKEKADSNIVFDIRP